MANDASQARTAKDLVGEAKARVENLTPTQSEEEVRQGALLVDIREENERVQNGSIPGAVHYPRGMLEFWADPTSPYHKPDFDPERRIILHCASGGRSALATDTLQKMGYRNVAHMDGGFTKWKEEGRKVEGGQS
jgi:rhodanese-related sulfurtransferase